MRALVVLLPLFAACIPVNSVAIGPVQPPRPRNCPLRIVKDAPEDLQDDWQRVGAICLAGSRADILYWGATRDALTEEACHLGGELITASGTCSVGRDRGTEFAVMRARAASQ
jgi:hypothetical protein